MLAWMGVSVLACGERKVGDGMAEGSEEAAVTTDTDTTDTTDTTDEPGTETDGCSLFQSCEEQPEELCDPIEQDCPEGEKCVWYAHQNSGLRREAAKCIPVTGDLAAFEPCTLQNGTGPEITDDCDAESYCLEVYRTADHGFCAPFIDGYEYSCDAYPGTSSAIENGSNFPSACLHYECQPLLPGSCPEGMQCTFYPAFIYGTTMCWYVPAQSELPLRAACDFGECGAGKLCALAKWVPGCEADRCCAQWCDLDAPACDDLDASCLWFPHSAFPYAGDEADFESLGACVLPGSFD